MRHARTLIPGDSAYIEAMGVWVSLTEKPRLNEDGTWTIRGERSGRVPLAVRTTQEYFNTNVQERYAQKEKKKRP